MARTYTRGELRTRLEQLTDTENDAHIGTTEKNEILNSAIAETWDKIVSSGLAEKYVKSVSFSAVADQLEYQFSTVVSAGDFYRIHQLYAVEGSGNDQLRPLQRIAPGEIHTFTPPKQSASLKLYYIPCAPQISSDNTTFDGINGWEEHTLMTAACAIKLKKEDDWSVFARRKGELEKRIQSMGNVDMGEPARVVRKRSRRIDPWIAYTNHINAYGVRGDKLELYSLSGYAGYYP